MMDHETLSLTALDLPGRIPDNVRNGSTSWYKTMMPRRDEGPRVTRREKFTHAENVNNSQNKKLLPRGNRSLFRSERRKSEIHQTVPITLKSIKDVAVNSASRALIKPAVEKLDQMQGNINGNTYTTSDVTNDQYAPQSGEHFIKLAKTKSQKSGKLHRRVANGSRSLTKVTRNTATRPSRKVNKSTVRQIEKISFQEPEVIGLSAPLTSTCKDLETNKAENNNLMSNADESSSVQVGLVLPTFHATSRASSFSTFMQSKSFSKPITRAASTDDISVSLLQRSYLQRSEKFKGHCSARLSAAGPNDSKLILSAPDQYNSYKKNSLERRYAKGSNCSSPTKQDEIHHGPLDDLKAYAQIIANRFKEILLLSPVSWQSEESMPDPITKREKDENTIIVHNAEDISNKSVPGVLLHRHRTEINMTSQQTRPKSLTNKSLSYDERVGTGLDEKGRRSPMYWINQDNSKVSESISKLSNSSVSNNEEDGYTLGKDGKYVLVTDMDTNSKTGRTEKPKAKMSAKQLAGVERAKTEGDLRTHIFQQLTSNKKQGKGNRSKTFYEVTADSDQDNRCSYEHQEKTDTINISRLKVIHEGSPVDPPYTIERKRSDEGKDRKAMFLRSATSPQKSYIQKRDIVNADKLNTLEGAVRANRSNTKIIVRTNKASTLRREISLSEKQKVQEFLKGSSRKENSKITTTLFKKRSTSYDGSQPGQFVRDEVQKSISLFTIADDEEEGKLRKAVSAENICIQRENESEDEFSMQSNVAVHTQENQARKVLSTDPFFQSELSSDIFEYQVKGNTNKDLLYENPKDILSVTDKQIEPMLSENRSSYFNNIMYYKSDLEKQLFQEDALVHDQCESYYYCSATPQITNQRDAHVLKSFEDDVVYHDRIKKYDETETSLGKNSPWYSAHQESTSDERALVRRDRSLESKSSTSFHFVSTAKSSHSDEMLMKGHGSWDHAFLRKQSMYTETDVDTGVIYHLAKRQTTRAHVPPYRDLTNMSRDIYTMSGDVSTTTSATSTRSESECAYTGGLFKDEHFKEIDKKISYYNSKESSSNIYFEPDGISKRESSELDIYTGNIFNRNENTHVPNTTHLKDGSTNNSTCATMGKVQRRVRYRPCMGAIKATNNNSAWVYFSEALVACGEYNTSNNSSNWCGEDDFEGSFSQGSMVIKSKDPLYTDYDPGMRPEFHVNTVEKTVPVFDFLKYESQEDLRAQYPPPKNENSGGSATWYSGMLNGASNDYPEKTGKVPDHSPDKCLFSWQLYDDYYMSTVRPRIKKANRGDIPRNSWNMNNNHFDDIYTGSYGAQNVQPRVQEQTNNNRQQPATDIKQPAASNFYEQYDSLYASPASARRFPSAINEPPKTSHSSTSVFGRESTSTSETSFYMPDVGWRNYESTQKPPIKSFDEQHRQRRSSPERTSSDDTESYFQYITNKSPGKSFYISDEETYSFEQKVVKEKSPEPPAIPEVKTVGGIVCRENVANQEDYAEDINRDLEPGPWIPFTLRRDDDARYPLELGHDRPEVPRAIETFGQAQGIKYLEDSSYAHNRVYDNLGARNKWREMASKKENEITRSRETSQNRSYQAGDTGKQDHGKAKRNASNIQEKTKGKRSSSNTSKTAAFECSGANKSSGTTSFKYKRH